MRHHTTVSIALACLLVAITATAQVDPLKERGFAPEKAYQIGDIDSINTFNGNLIVTIPLGGSYPVNGGLSFSIGLSYNGDIWDLTGVTYDSGQTWFTRAEPCRSCNAGPGFMVSLGRLLAPSDPDNRTPQSWTFIGPDGSEHIFYTSLHDGEPTYSGYWYSRDGSYIRLKNTASGKNVEFSDGTFRSFVEYQTGKWRITAISDQFGNYVNVTYPDANTWQITDMHNRSHYVRFTNGVVTSVELAKYPSGTAQYSIQYTQDTFNRSCEDNDPQSSDTVVAYRPTSITLPDGSTWSSFAYHTQACPTPPAKAYPIGLSSRLAGVSMPTGAKLEWDYKDYKYMTCAWDPKANPPRYNCAFTDNTGVGVRRLKDSSGNLLGTWRYDPYTQYVEVPATHKLYAEKRILKLLDPQGNSTLSFSELDATAWDYGLAYERYDAADSGGRYLSQQFYSGNADVVCANPPETDACTILGGSLERSVFLKYEHDKIPTSAGAQEKRNTNRRAASQRTVYVTDGGFDVIADSFNFDGLGHYRTTVTAGHADLGPLSRKITNLNSWAGTYKLAADNSYDTTNYDAYTQFTGVESPAHNYTTQLPNGWPTDKPWILGSYDYEQQDQYDTNQTPNLTSARQDYCFEKDAGGTYAAKPFILRKRVFTSGTSASATDLVSVYAHDSGGNTYLQQDYGGDTQSLGTTALCSLSLPSTDSYRVQSLYQYGALKYSRYHDGSGNPLSFFTLDLDINQNTGLPTASRDTAGVQTNIEYDSRGRIAWLKPQTANPAGGAWVEYTYTNFSGGGSPTRARARALSHPNNQPTGTPLAGEEYEYDWLGRLAVEKRLLPTQSWPASGPCTTQCNQRLTTYNAMGWKDSVSEWQGYNPATVYTTLYVNFDPFGRPGIIRPPDGSAHDVTLTYAGIRSVARTVKIATAQGSETAVTSSEEYDRQGRLLKVSEYSDPANPTTYVPTTYSYDVGNRLKQASTTAGATTQVRNFTYDNRGFLTSEQLPEVGASGNGTVAYSKYDARGHYLRRQDAAHDLAYSYDRAERLTQIAQADGSGNPATPVLTTLAYATTNNGTDMRNGKLLTATSANSDLTSGSVVETYAYASTGGRASSRQTVVEGRTVNQAFTWNDLGQIASLGYPNDTVLADAVEPPRTISYTYTNGFLTAVPSYLSAISYHANGMVNQLTHANATKALYGKDPNDMARPASITLQRTADSSTLWQSSTYAYDGAGNIKTIGSDFYTYDKVSRLSVGTTSSGTLRQCVGYTAFGTINAMGTGTTACTPSTIAVDTATNRMSSPVTYDAAGNMTLWGVYGYTWNRLNQMLTVTGTGINRSYGYTADGERAVDRNNQDSTRTLWIRDLSGKVLREYSRTAGGTWSWSKDYVYRNGLHVASVTSSTTRHFALDHLGTLRRGTDTQATPQLDSTLTRDFYPFGQGTGSGSSAESMGFTGHQRDTFGTTAQTDDLDYMHARYYNPNTARFLSVDPGRDVDPKIPQAWNMYAYVRGNPVSSVDRDGRETGSVTNSGEWGMNPGGTLPLGQEAALWGGMALAFGGAYAAAQGVLNAAPLLVSLAANPRLPQLAEAVTEMAAPPGAMSVPTLGSISSMVKPGGVKLGAELRSAGNFGFVGTQKDALLQFNKLVGGASVAVKGGIRVAEIPGGGTVTYRLASSTKGVVATIQFKVEGLGVKTWKYFEDAAKLKAAQ
jgi:RHS repeat-associated protein